MPAGNATALMDWSISVRRKSFKGKLKFCHWKTGVFCVKIPLFPEKNQRYCGRFRNRDPLSPGSRVNEEFFRRWPPPDTRHSMIFPDKTEERSYFTKILCDLPPWVLPRGFQCTWLANLGNSGSRADIGLLCLSSDPTKQWSAVQNGGGHYPLVHFSWCFDIGTKQTWNLQNNSHSEIQYFHILHLEIHVVRLLN